MTEKIINRIKKMLALANDLAATEGEREAALRAAYSTMTKYNIGMATVAQHGAPEARIDFDNQSFSWMWAKQVNGIIGKLFFCKVLIGRKINGTQVEYHFIGKESNAMTAAVMADWIVKSILKEGRKLYKENTSPGMRAFAMGAMARLGTRVDELIKQEQAQATPGTALVLVDLYRTEETANDEFVNERYGELRKSRSVAKGKLDRTAFEAGLNYGDSINLNKQVEGTKDKPQLN